MKKLTFYKSRPADLSLALLTNADLDILRTYIRVQLGLGASKLFIYYDGKLPRGKIAELQRDPRVSVRNMQDTFEQQNVKGVVHKQRFVYDHAYGQCETSWLGICDVDEFIIADEPLADFLDRVPEAQVMVRAVSNEVVWTERANVDLPFSGRLARSALNPDVSGTLIADLYGEYQDFYSEYGLISHYQGKYLIRTGLDIHVQVHRVTPVELNISEAEAECLTLVHHDAISFGHWVNKMALKKAKRTRVIQSRRHQLGHLGETDDRGRRKFFDQLFRLNHRSMDVLDRQGTLSKLPSTWTLRIKGWEIPTVSSIFRPYLTYYRRRAIDFVRRVSGKIRA